MRTVYFVPKVLTDRQRRIAKAYGKRKETSVIMVIGK